MLKFMLPAVLSTGFALPVADAVPTLAFEQSCREVARADPLKQITVEACFKQETEARDQLKNDWTAFSAGDRSHCLNLTNIGSRPSYVELITCLQVSRDARQLRQQQSPTEGAGNIQDISREKR